MRVEMDELHRAYLSVGSNIEPEANLPKAIRLLREYGKVLEISAAWESRPVGAEGPNFLNACVLFLSNLPSYELKEEIIRPIEAALGRVRYADKNAPRTIDLDIVLFDGQPLNVDFWDYAFVIVPLAELIPDFNHPTRGEKLIHAAEQLRKRIWMAPRPDVNLSQR